MTLEDHIRRYLALVLRADRLFESVLKAHPELMACMPGCDDCCFVFFDLSLIEAFYISGMFRDSLPSATRERVLARAEDALPLFREAGEIFRDISGKDSKGHERVHEAAAKIRIPCPLNEDHGCVLYEHRPITCRLYGTPQKIAGRVVSCPRAGFKAGESYVTVDVDTVQRELSEQSSDLLRDLMGKAASRRPGPRFSLPMALKTHFNRDFFLALKSGSIEKEKA